MVTRTKRHKTNGTNNTGKWKYYNDFSSIFNLFKALLLLSFFPHLMHKTTSIFNKSYHGCQQFAMRELTIYTTISPLLFLSFSPCFHVARLRGSWRSERKNLHETAAADYSQKNMVNNEWMCIWCWMLDAKVPQ